MPSESWKTFLIDQGAHWDTYRASHFGDQTFPSLSSERCHLADLSHWGGFIVEGSDARKFLQGQVTCDIKALSPQNVIRGTHCNVKGRAEFSFHITQLVNTEKDAFALLMPASTVTIAQQTLGKYIVFSKADIKPLDDIILFGLIGKPNSEVFNSLSDLPVQPGQAVQQNDFSALKIDRDRLLCLVPKAQAEKQWLSLANLCQLSGYPAWDLSGIINGIGEVEAQTQGEFIPQFLNFHLNHEVSTPGISFTKGCYIGQEVVARMEYRGTLKKHMRRAKTNSPTLPALGASLYLVDSEQSIGNVVSAVTTDTDSIELLAVVNDQAFEQNQVFLDQQKNYKLQFLALPYAITK